MKKYLFILLAVTLFFTLTACGGSYTLDNTDNMEALIIETETINADAEPEATLIDKDEEVPEEIEAPEVTTEASTITAISYECRPGISSSYTFDYIATITPDDIMEIVSLRDGVEIWRDSAQVIEGTFLALCELAESDGFICLPENIESGIPEGDYSYITIERGDDKLTKGGMGILGINLEFDGIYSIFDISRQIAVLTPGGPMSDRFGRYDLIILGYIAEGVQLSGETLKEEFPQVDNYVEVIDNTNMIVAVGGIIKIGTYVEVGDQEGEDFIIYMFTGDGDFACIFGFEGETLILSTGNYLLTYAISR